MVLQGILTVGLKFGPDGALYLADWITGWDAKEDGRIWKVDAPVGRGERDPERSAVAAVAELREPQLPPISACCSSMPTSACG